MQRGLTIEQVAQDTRISARFLEALEAETFEDLPAPVYVRGFLRSYANFLHVDPTPLLESLALTQGTAAAASNGHGQQNGGGRRNSARQDPFARNPGRSAAPDSPLSVPIPSAPAEEAWNPDEVGPDPRYAEPLVPAAVETFEPDETYEDHSARYLDEPILYRPRGVSGVLTERESGDRDPAATTRMLGIIAGVAIAAIAILALAVFLTSRGGDDGSSNNNAAVPNSNTPTPRAAGSVIAVASGTVNASASPSATVSGTSSPGVTGTASPAGTPGTPTPTRPAGTVTATPTAPETATPATPAPTSTPAPTATPTQPPPTPTRVAPPAPTGQAFSECTGSGGSYDCGPGPYRVICFAPINSPQNNNWWVDVDQNYPSPLPEGWRETYVSGGNGAIIKAGQGTNGSAPCT